MQAGRRRINTAKTILLAPTHRLRPVKGPGSWSRSMADVAPPPSPPAYDDTSTDSEISHISTDDKSEASISQISASWHRFARAEWQSPDGQEHSLPDLALSLCYCSVTNTSFFKLQTRVDLEGCKHYYFYLHVAPERMRHLALVSPTSTQENDPNTRCLRFEMTQPAILVAPCWPCRVKNPQAEKTLQLLQLLGQAAVFTLVVSIPLRFISDASFRALSDALANQTLKSDPDQSNIRRYYRGQGGIAIDLGSPPIVDVLKGKQPQSGTEESSELPSGPADVPPSYNQAVTDASSPDPLTCSPPNKKRRLDSPIAEQDDLLAPSTKSFREDIKQTIPETSQLSLFRSMFEHFDKTMTELKEENRQLKQAVSEVADMRTTIATLNSKVESLERRLDAEGEELERRVDGLEDGLTSLDAWTEDHHEYDADQVKDVVREVFEDDFDNMSDRLIERIIDRLRGGP
ncbi:uncharacterized protein PG998_009053 [Apiospora kogelbergensis]|uniref:uncharacterized protein n=1 Tax=Apiospora kogelbergensis TaxID=1337665 RepID=UPI00313247BB